jgi:CcmD family protein
MTFIKELHRGLRFRASTIIVLVVLALTISSLLTTVAAYDGQPSSAPATISAPLEHGDGDPEANLPFLFAVFMITWGAFFAFVFYMSRRQREMQGEIEALKRALAQREQAEAQSKSES